MKFVHRGVMRKRYSSTIHFASCCGGFMVDNQKLLFRWAESSAVFGWVVVCFASRTFWRLKWMDILFVILQLYMVSTTIGWHQFWKAGSQKPDLCWKCGFFAGPQVDFQLDSRQPSVGRLSSFGVQKCTPPSNMGYIYIWYYIYICIYIYINVIYYIL
jgi:hypothetical protein